MTLVQIARQETSAKDRRRAIQNLNRTVMGFIGLLVVYALGVAWYSWGEEKSDALKNLATVTELEARAVDGYFTHLAGDLKGLADDLARKDQRIDLDQAYLAVRTLKERHPELYNVTLIRSDGTVLLTARNPPGTIQASLDREPSFITFLDELKQGKALALGQPLVAVVSKVAIVPVRHAVKDRNGDLSYIISANLPHEHLRSFWMDAPITAQAALGLMRDNGFLLSRCPVPDRVSLDQIYGQPRSGALINYLRQLGFPERGSVQGPSSLDGPDHLSVFRRLPNYPVTMFAALPMTAVRTAWWNRVSGIFVALLLLLGGGLAAHRYALQRQSRWDEAQLRLERAQRESEERFRTLIEENNAIILQIDPSSGKILDANLSALRFYGWSREEMCAMTIQEINQLNAEELAAELQAAVDGRRKYFEFRHRLANGEIRTVEVHSTPIRVANESLLVSIIHDITGRKQAEGELVQYKQNLERLVEERTATREAAMSSMSDAVFITDTDGRFIDFNEAFARFVRFKSKDECFKAFADYPTILDVYLPSGERLPPEQWGVPRALRGESANDVEYVLQRKQTGEKWVGSFNYAPVRDGNGVIIGAVVSGRDITERKKVEAELLQSREHLEHQVAQRTLELVAAKEAAEAANIAKSRFLATMSHEIRTPMNGILGMAQMLLMPNLKQAERQDYARTVLNSGQTLLTLLNDVLDLSKVEAGRIELESIVLDPARVVHESQILFAEAARQKGLRLESQWTGAPAQRYLGDPYRLRQMLANLVGNAIKFTVQGKIHLAAREIERDDSGAVLEFAVADTGIGIAEDQRKKLFQRFSQADSSTTRHFGGTGLGLSIVRSLAQLMGGEVGVESEAGRGSRFWFRIRAGLVTPGEDSRLAQRREQFWPSEVPAQLAGRVLVVEDTETSRRVTQVMLHALGLSVVLAEDGQAGFDAMTGGDEPDLVLMDLRMPGMDGYQASTRIRQWEVANDRPRRPIVALTADAEEGTRQRCLALGMDEVVTKPIAIDTLAAVLGRYLGPAACAEPAAGSAAITNEAEAERIAALVAELEPLLAGGKFDAIERFRNLQEALAGTDVAAEMNEVARLLREVRFEPALEQLRRIAFAHGWKDKA